MESINVLAAFGCEGWERLPEITQLRLEAAIINDIHTGSFDIYGANTGNPGALGTYANEFWSYFGNRVGLVEAVITKLKSGWHNQNYIGKYFLSLLPSISDTPARRHLLIEALQYAVEMMQNWSLVTLRRYLLIGKKRPWKAAFKAHNLHYATTSTQGLNDIRDDCRFGNV